MSEIQDPLAFLDKSAKDMPEEYDVGEEYTVFLSDARRAVNMQKAIDQQEIDRAINGWMLQACYYQALVTQDEGLTSCMRTCKHSRKDGNFCNAIKETAK